MSLPLVEKIANAVLYEGYLLYPYRSSAVKNRQRWNFGVVYPQRVQRGARRGRARAKCRRSAWRWADRLTALSVKVRCLRLVERVAGYLAQPVPNLSPMRSPYSLPPPRSRSTAALTNRGRRPPSAR